MIEIKKRNVLKIKKKIMAKQKMINSDKCSMIKK